MSGWRAPSATSTPVRRGWLRRWSGSAARPARGGREVAPYPLQLARSIRLRGSLLPGLRPGREGRMPAASPHWNPWEARARPVLMSKRRAPSTDRGAPEGCEGAWRQLTAERLGPAADDWTLRGREQSWATPASESSAAETHRTAPATLGLGDVFRRTELRAPAGRKRRLKTPPAVFRPGAGSWN
jgi:hypothetical protein